MSSAKFEDLDAVRVVTIDRPHVRNAVDSDTASALAAAFEDFEADEGLAVAVLTGAQGTFCSGADLAEIAAGREISASVGEGRGPMGPTRLRLSKPVIAAIEGYAVAGGLELALWCDLRVAGSGAVLGFFNRRFGVPLVDLGTVRLPRLVGQGRALDLILTGRGVGAAEALQMGLVDRVVAAGEALTAAVELAGELASHPPAAMRNDRLSVLRQWGLDEDEAVESEWALGEDTIRHGEAQAGARAFVAGEGRHGDPR